MDFGSFLSAAVGKLKVSARIFDFTTSLWFIAICSSTLLTADLFFYCNVKENASTTTTKVTRKPALPVANRKFTSNLPLVIQFDLIFTSLPHQPDWWDFFFYCRCASWSSCYQSKNLYYLKCFVLWRKSTFQLGSCKIPVNLYIGGELCWPAVLVSLLLLLFVCVRENDRETARECVWERDF